MKPISSLVPSSYHRNAECVLSTATAAVQQALLLTGRQRSEFWRRSLKKIL